MNASQFGSKALQVLKAIAPTLATALGGPFGPLAGAVLSQVLGTKDQKDTEAALVAGNSDTLLKLKQAELDFQTKMTELGIEKDKLAYDDMKDARAREVAVKDRTPTFLAYLVIGGFMAMCTGMVIGLFCSPDKASLILKGEAGLFLGTLFGYLASEAKQASAYYFGSTLGSQAKDQTLADLAKGSGDANS